jgi:hypothetical protein
MLVTLLAASTVSVATGATPAHATVYFHMCYGSGVGTTCKPQYVYSTRSPTWSVPNQTGTYRLTFQTDCNLVFYDPGYSGGVSWSSGTYSIPRPCTLKWQGDGNMVIYDHNGTARWATMTLHGTYGGYAIYVNDIGQFWIDYGATHEWCNHPSSCTYQ